MAEYPFQFLPMPEVVNFPTMKVEVGDPSFSRHIFEAAGEMALPVAACLEDSKKVYSPCEVPF